MDYSKRVVKFYYDKENDCYDVNADVNTINGIGWGFIGVVGKINVANRWGFQPSKEITFYSEFTLRKIANFVRKLNRKLEKK